MRDFMRNYVRLDSSRILLVLALVVLPTSLSNSTSIENDGFQNSSNASFLWRINSEPPAFMFGTIHVPYTRVWDAVPINAKEAFWHSRQIHFELDLTNHATLSALSSCQLLPGGQHLSQLLPTDMYLRLKMHLDYIRGVMEEWLTADQQESGYDTASLFSTITANWERKRPVWVMMMVNSLTKSDIASRGVPVLDLFLSKLAERQRKKISAIETVEEQCRPLNDLSHDQVLFALNQTLQYHENLRLGVDSAKLADFSTDDIVTQYRRGSIDSSYFNQDTFQIPSLYLKGQRLSRRERQMAIDTDKYFRENLIELRNKRMAARIIDLLMNKPDSYFFALGAGHFVGRYSILEVVKSAGFQIDHISREAVLDFPSRNKISGTFDDLPNEEKTRALLQFLHYRQHLEKIDSTKKFEAMVGGIHAGEEHSDGGISDLANDFSNKELKRGNGLSNNSSASLRLRWSSTMIVVFLALFCLLKPC